jgi:microcystin-dependent protein
VHKIDTTGATAQNTFTVGGGGVPATVIGADWPNAVQAELVAVIEGAGATLSKADNGQLLTAIQALIAAASWSTGDVKLTMRTSAPAGWVMCNDGTIGSATSGATTRANADTEALFLLLWTNVADAQAPVSGGRGVSAAADWAASKTIGLTKMLGRALAVAGSGAGLTARALGLAVGAETHVLGVTEMPAHMHNYSIGVLGPGVAAGGDANAFDQDSETTESTGGGGAHNNVQPSAFLNAQIKL